MKNRRVNMAVYLVALVALCDQLSKWWIVNEEMQPEPHLVRVTSFLNFGLVWNKGITFGFLNRVDHHLMAYFLAAVAVVIVFLLARWLWRTTSMAVTIALGFIMGGAIGNVIDRIHYGAVVDFLDFYYRDYHWYAFNVADAAIVTGVGLLLLDSLVRGK